MRARSLILVAGLLPAFAAISLAQEAAVPVPGVRTSFVQGVGMYFAASASLIFASEQP